MPSVVRHADLQAGHWPAQPNTMIELQAFHTELLVRGSETFTWRSGSFGRNTHFTAGCCSALQAARFSCQKDAFVLL